ncbi:MAG: hypothetical protein WC933_03060 [Candidatus Paceibacterota bacterium]|jgi:hypothetical protein
MTINDEDRDFISNFPDLKFKDNDRILSGKLSFIVRFDRKSKKYSIYNKAFSATKDKYLIKDDYDIEIDLSLDNIYRGVAEVGNKIEGFAKAKNINLRDLHYYVATKKVCLIGYFDEDKDISLKDFIGKVVVPFFYDQSFFNGQGKWPRGQYSHGYLGVLENYRDVMGANKLNEDISIKCINILKEIGMGREEFVIGNIRHLLRKKKIKSHWNCIHCGFEKLVRRPNERRRHRKPKVSNFRSCHPKALEGLKILHRNIRKFNLKFEE